MKIISRTDLRLNLAVIILLSIGLISLLSSSPINFYKQLFWIILGSLFAFVIIFIDVKSFFRNNGFVFSLYALMNILLLATVFFAPKIKGNGAWLVVGPFQFQPSEIAKVILVIFLAYFFSKKHTGIAFWGTVLSSFMYAIIPIFLIMLQPDLGSAVIMFVIWGGFVLFSGLPIKKILISAIVAICAFVALWGFVLQDYQKDRIVGVFNPELDPLGVNYSVIQSKISIGSGGFWGKGFEQGTQVQLGFLPEAQTDFIFAAIAEEGGLIASVILILIFFYMLVRIIKIGIASEENMLKFISLGAGIVFFIQFLINVGSNVGIFPVIGVTLPFVSYGGSSVFSSIFLIGVIQSLYARR